MQWRCAHWSSVTSSVPKLYALAHGSLPRAGGWSLGAGCEVSGAAESAVGARRPRSGHRRRHPTRGYGGTQTDGMQVVSLNAPLSSATALSRRDDPRNHAVVRSGASRSVLKVVHSVTAIGVGPRIGALIRGKVREWRLWDAGHMSEQRAPAEQNAADTSWAPIGWEQSDIDFDDAPFGSVLGDPLMGSPIFDVSVLDAAPASDGNAAGPAVDTDDAPSSAQAGGARRATAQLHAREQYRQAVRPGRQQPLAGPQVQTPAPATAAVGAPTVGEVRPPVLRVPGNPSFNPYAEAPSGHPQPSPSMPQISRPAQAPTANSGPWASQPHVPGRGPYVQAPSRGVPSTSRREGQTDDAEGIGGFISVGIWWVVAFLLLIIFSNV